MYVGVDYYPEHWPRERWDFDARAMRRAGFNVVRLAEFAWVKLEPVEGRFEFAWLDEALAVLNREGISAILGTPTGAMPAWVARKYPEALAVQPDGMRMNWGHRKNNCFSNGTFRLLSERITRALAEHYAGHRGVIGWQTDNEFGHPYCYCATCRAEWQDWLRAKYGTLAALHAAWGTHFWGHDYGDWSEIQIPIDQGGQNPGACLDWRRFYSWLNVRFQHDQVRILRECCPRQFVTHNFMGLFPVLDYYDLARDLDFVSWDNYPVWGEPAIRYETALSADLMRGLKGRNFWIMEQTAGPCGSSDFGRNPHPGEIRSIAHQAVAHGAAGMVWFRWRTCTVGREQYWHGLLGHDGKLGRRYHEASRTAAELQKVSRAVGDAKVAADAAILYDYESLWALEIQPGIPKDNYTERVRCYHRALFRAGVGLDLIPPSADFGKYKLLLAPALHVLPDELAERLLAYVRAGGVLFTDYRTGVKDEYNRCHARTLPGKLATALGVVIEEYGSIGAGAEFPLADTPGFRGRYHCHRYADWLRAESAEVLLRHTAWPLAKFAALTRNRLGKGSAWHLGTVVKEEGFYDQLIGALLAAACIRPVLRPPPGVEAVVRRGRKGRFLFLINHLEEKVEVPVPNGKPELLSGRKTGKKLILDRHGVAVIRIG